MQEAKVERWPSVRSKPGPGGNQATRAFDQHHSGRRNGIVRPGIRDSRLFQVICEARGRLSAKVVARWDEEAGELGIGKRGRERMTSAFNHDDLQQAAHIR